jgi:hypothetical protein
VFDTLGIMKTRQVVRVALLLSLAALAAGCRGSLKPAKTAPVHGVVVYRGLPVRYVMVTLEPVDVEGVEVTAATGADGTFELRTNAGEEQDGAVPGTYRVTLRPYDATIAGALPKGEKATDVPPDALKKFEMTFEVRDGEDNELDILIP